MNEEITMADAAAMMDELINSLQDLIDIDDKQFGAIQELLRDTIHRNMTNTEMETTARTTAQNYRDGGYSRGQMIESIQEIKQGMYSLVDGLIADNPDISQEKEDFLEYVKSQIGMFYDSVGPLYDLEHPNVKFFREDENAKLPTYAHTTDQGADIYSPVDITIAPHTTSTLVPTGLRAVIPEGWALAIRARSGLSKKTGLRISNAIGTIDCSYRGSIRILFDNISDTPVEIKTGDRIAQFILEKCYQMEMEEITDMTPYQTERGEGGFGSSGK